MKGKLLDKYYLATLEEIPWGIYERDADTFNEGKRFYDMLKDEMKDVPCTVILFKVEVYEEDTDYTVVYKKQLNKDKDIELLYKELLKLINTISELGELYSNIEKSSNDSDLKFLHGLELANLRRTTGEQRDNILYKEKASRLRRRQAKTQACHFKKADNQRKIILEAAKTALISIDARRKRYEKKDFSKRDEEYMAALGLNMDYTSSTSIAEVITETVVEKDTLMELLSNSDNNSGGVTIGEILKSKLKIG